MENNLNNSNFSFKNRTLPNEESDKPEQPFVSSVPVVIHGDDDEWDSERIPTVPQVDNNQRIPTVPQVDNNQRIPTVPQVDNNQRIPTVPQVDNNQRIPTVPQQETIQQMQTGKKVLLYGTVQFTSAKGETFLIDGKQVVSADSGESEIYRCHSQNESEPLVARILKSVTPRDSITKRKSREKVLNFLTRASHEPNSHILPLLDYGTVNINGQDYYVEIYPFCEEGDLGKQQGKIPYYILCRKVIPAINEALHQFHEAGFVHRDVKPDNLYWYHGEVVIGDFGITCSLRGDEFTIDKTKTGTLGYYAPELMLNEIVPASDYYSFGQTLWTLYKGHMMYSDLLRHYSRMGVEEQRARINHAMMSNTYYELDEIRKDESFFEILIRGLLQYDIIQRFQYEKVKRWLAGDRSLAHEIGNYQDAKIFTRALKLFRKECWDSEEVAQLLWTRENWNSAKELLYNGYIKDFFSSQSAEFETTRFLDDIMKRYAVGKTEKQTPFWNDVGLAKVIMRLNHYQWFAWQGFQFHNIRELGNTVTRMLNRGRITKICDSFLASEIMLEWYQHQPHYEETELKALKQITKYSQDSIDGLKIACRWLKEFRFSESWNTVYCGCHNVNELIDYLLREKNTLYLPTPSQVPIVDDWEFLAILCMWGYEESVRPFYRLLSSVLYERFELLFDFLESHADEKHKKKIRQYYHDYGTMSYLYWLQQNLELYTYKGEHCNELKSRIKAVLLDSTAPIEQQRKLFSRLQILSAEFQTYNRSNIFMAHLGLINPNATDCIYSNHSDAMWGFQFLNKTVPIGYLKYIGLQEGEG